jgi:hypothetical protein
MCHVLPRRRHAAWLRAAPHGGEATYAYTTTGALGRMGACRTDDAARRAVGTEEGACPTDGAARQRSPRGQRGRGGAAASLGCVLRLHGGEVTYAYYDHGRAAAPGRVPDRRRGQARCEEGALW